MTIVASIEKITAAIDAQRNRPANELDEDPPLAEPPEHGAIDHMEGDDARDQERVKV
jgi:hypothetical protein